jgi:hypothetical protein
METTIINSEMVNKIDLAEIIILAVLQTFRTIISAMEMETIINGKMLVLEMVHRTFFEILGEVKADNVVIGTEMALESQIRGKTIHLRNETIMLVPIETTGLIVWPRITGMRPLIIEIFRLVGVQVQALVQPHSRFKLSRLYRIRLR